MNEETKKPVRALRLVMLMPEPLVLKFDSIFSSLEFQEFITGIYTPEELEHLTESDVGDDVIRTHIVEFLMDRQFDSLTFDNAKMN